MILLRLFLAPLMGLLFALFLPILGWAALLYLCVLPLKRKRNSSR